MLTVHVHEVALLSDCESILALVGAIAGRQISVAALVGSVHGAASSTATAARQIAMTALEGGVHGASAQGSATEVHLNASLVGEGTGVVAVAQRLAVDVNAEVDRLIVEHGRLVGTESAVQAVRVVERWRRVEVVARVTGLQGFGELHAQPLAVVVGLVRRQTVEHRCRVGGWRRERSCIWEGKRKIHARIERLE